VLTAETTVMDPTNLPWCVALGKHGFPTMLAPFQSVPAPFYITTIDPAHYGAPQTKAATSSNKP